MRDIIYALVLAFAQPDGSAIAVPLNRDMGWEQCMETRERYLRHDPDTQGVLLCVDQSILKPREREVELG